MPKNTARAEPAAWEDAPTRRAWKRAAAWGGAWLIAGAGLLFASGEYANGVIDGSDDLKANGIRVTATVLADQAASRLCGQVEVPVAFALEGAEHEGTLSIGGCDERLANGEEITLYVDPADPARLVSEASDDEDHLAVWLASAALVAGVALLACAVVRGFRLQKIRRTLRRAPWRECPADYIELTAAWRGAVPLIHLRGGHGDGEMLVPRWPGTLESATVMVVPLAPDEVVVEPLTPTVFVAQVPANWTVLALRPGGVPRAVRRATPSEARRAREMLDRDPDTEDWARSRERPANSCSR